MVKAVGSKAEVYHGTARHTSGGLKKKDLMKTRRGRIVSRKQHAAGKKAIRRLFTMGYRPKKGAFGLFRKGHAATRATRATRGRRRQTRRHRGGSSPGAAASMDIEGTPLGDVLKTISSKLSASNIQPPSSFSTSGAAPNF